MSSAWSTTASMCGQSPGGGHVDQNQIVGKPYRLDETLYKSSAHAWKKRRLSRAPLLHVLYRRDCLEGSRRCTHQMMPSVAREAAWNLIFEPAGMPRCCL